MVLRAAETTADSLEETKICPRCKEKPATVNLRNNLLCPECFKTHIGRMVARSLNAYKYRSDRPQHILAEHLKRSGERVGKYGYLLHVLVMDDMSVFREPEDCSMESLERLWALRRRYDQKDCPMIKSFTWRSTEDTFDALELATDDISGLLSGVDISSSKGEDAGGSFNTQSSPYRKFIGSLSSLSAQADANSVVTRRLIVRYAHEVGCDTVVWGDTTTRLAERTLAETAKGRGFSIPWQTGDGPSPYGVEFICPLREVLRKDIVSYANLIMPPLDSLVKKGLPVGSAHVSSKDATIDALMMQYFGSVEENYPSIVTNVVRTSAKLMTGPLPTERNCQICGLPVPKDGQGLHGWAGSQEDDQPNTREFLCYGCARTSKGRQTRM